MAPKKEPKPRDPEDVAIGQRVRAARIRSGLSREEVDARLPDGLKFKTYGAIERGDRKVRPHEFAPLAEALRVTVDELTDPPAATVDLETLHAELQKLRAEVLEARQERATAAASIQRLLEDQDRLLHRQSEILESIEAGVAREREAKRLAEVAAQEMRDLVAAMGVASQALLTESPSTATARGRQAK